MKGIFTVYCILIMNVASTFAQRQDYIVSGGLELKKQFSRSFDVSFAHLSMMNQNASEWWISSFDAGVGYKFSRSWKAEIHYRQMNVRIPENYFESRNLFYSTLSYGRGFGKWYFLARARWQSLVYGDHFNDGYKGPRWYNRNKFSVRYRINYFWQPYVSTECFIPTNNLKRQSIDQWRYTAGVFRYFNERFKAECNVQYQRQVNRNNPRRNVLTGLNLYYEF